MNKYLNSKVIQARNVPIYYCAYYDHIPKRFWFIFRFSCFDSLWQYQCINGFCQKGHATDQEQNSSLSLSECQLICSDYAGLWPHPSGEVEVSEELVTVDPTIKKTDNFTGTPISDLVEIMTADFKAQIKNKLKSTGEQPSNTYVLSLHLIIEYENVTDILLTTEEQYSLDVATGIFDANILQANITAQTVFGARHGLETLGQLIVYDDLRGLLKMPEHVSISDRPAYPHRGILFDTARNFVSIDTIKRTLVGMAASKLNTFHWHIVDSQSFPFQSKSLPELSELGAYSREKVYTPGDILDVIEFGRRHGVKIIPEFDAPAHVGEGWLNTGFVACFNAQPWASYCSEPPCGLFDPTNPKLYDALEGNVELQNLTTWVDW